jgi:hypothetical protein
MAEIRESARTLGGSDTATTGRGVLGVTTTSQEVAPANPDRVRLVMTNLSGTVNIYLGLETPAVVNRGIRVNNANSGDNTVIIDYFTGRVNAVTTSGTRNLAFSEV